MTDELCHVRAAPDQPETDIVPYELPIGSGLTIGSERWRDTDVLFDPKFGAKDCMGMSASISTSIGRCDAFLRRELLQNVVINCGSTMFPGMATRVEHDVREATQSLADVIAAPERKNSAWVGGSIFASTLVFEQFQIKKADWKIQNKNIFRQKSFVRHRHRTFHPI
jgi:actin-related protein